MRLTAFAAVALVLFSLGERPVAQGPTTTGSFVRGQLIVTFVPGAAASDKAVAHREANGRRVDRIAATGVDLVAVSPGTETAAIARYRRNPNVLYAEPNFIRRVEAVDGPPSPVIPDDTHFSELYGLNNAGQPFFCIIPGFCLGTTTPDADIDAPEAWGISTGSSAIKVAVIDTGIDYTHPDLAPNYAGGKDYIHPLLDANGQPVLDANGQQIPTDTPMDDYSHGSHVAGIIAAAMNNLTGTPGAEEGVVGVAPKARLLAYKVCDLNGVCNDLAIQKAIDRAIVDGARVINMSLGETTYSASLDAAVQRASNAGVVVVGGAGNNNNQVLFYPAALPNVISVAAFDEDHRRASFSTYSKTWVDLSAPGNYVLSTVPMSRCSGTAQVPGDVGCYDWKSGTSMAAPYVAGAAAMVWSRSDVHSKTDVVEALLGGADGQGVDLVRLDSWTIHGGLNLYGAMTYTLTPPPPVNQPPTANAGPDQTVVDSDGNGTQAVTLDGRASTDADGTIQKFEWRRSGSESVIATGGNPTVSVAVGTSTFTLTVTDDDGAQDTDDVVITVQPPPATDTVTINKATYSTRQKQLTVEAGSSKPGSVTLTVYDATNAASPVRIGTLVYVTRKKLYTQIFNWPTKPTSITVVSSGGGSATRTVTSVK